jgi:hypothetical protein
MKINIITRFVKILPTPFSIKIPPVLMSSQIYSNLIDGGIALMVISNLIGKK